jgi:prophage tail gpP-like protein
LSNDRPEIRLIIDGGEVVDWESFEIASDLLHPADAWRGVISNQGAKNAGLISGGDSVQITIDGDVELSGFVDRVAYSNNRVAISGRDNFGHLVDVSATPGAHKQIKLDALAESLTSAWGMIWQVDPAVTLTQHRYVKIEPGETISDVLTRLARRDRALIWLDASGTAHIGRPDYDQLPSHAIYHHEPTNPAAQQNNVIEAEVDESIGDRYASITVMGASGNTSGQWGKTALQKQTDTDPSVPSGRVLILSDGDVKSISAAKRLATDEVDRRAFEGLVMRYTARGFYGTPPPGQERVKFEIDQRASVVDDFADVDGVYYLTARTFSFEEGGGYSTRLELHPGGWWEQ